MTYSVDVGKVGGDGPLQREDAGVGVDVEEGRGGVITDDGVRHCSERYLSQHVSRTTLKMLSSSTMLKMLNSSTTTCIININVTTIPSSRFCTL